MDDITPPSKLPTPPADAPQDPASTAPEIAEQPPLEPAPEPAEPQQPADSSADDFKTDEAVEDIMKQDGDADLKAQDAAAEPPAVMKTGWKEKAKNTWLAWWADPRKRYGTIAAVIAIIGALFAVPFTRYSLLGLVLKSQVTVQAVDSKTGAAVSGATVELGGQKAQTEANGKAVLRVHLGSKQLTANKKYYGGYTHKELVTLSRSRNSYKASLTAMGRQVQVKLVDKVTNQPISGATINVASANTKTKTNGLANVLIPSGAASQAAVVSASGYNTAPATIAGGDTLANNTFALVPTGKIYFLSNLSGNIDVVKANLDGSSRQTVLAGTGNEDPHSTSLLASRDWKYLALLSKRDGNYASLYLIDTTNGDKLTTVDQGNVNFNLVGWSGDRFVYQATRNDVQNWQSNQGALKSLDATTGQTLLLDQTQGSGNNQNDYVRQTFGSPYIIDDQVVYAKNWDASYQDASQLSGKSAELDSIGSNGSGHKVLKSFPEPDGTQNSTVNLTTELYEPDGLYIDFYVSGQDNFYKYDDGSVSSDSTTNANTFYQGAYPTFLLSPSGNNTFWAEPRDGKNTLFTGDTDGKSPKQIATLSDYNPYGWYSDKYLLVSKNSSELYIMPAGGGNALKITDYYKPPINYQGYGGGYGGL